MDAADFTAVISQPHELAMDRPLPHTTAFIAALSCLAGMTDAIGLIAAGSFVSFMSGNTTNFAVALARLDMGHAGRLAVVVTLFVLGCAMGEAIAARGACRHRLDRPGLRGGISVGQSAGQLAGQRASGAHVAVIGTVALLLTATSAGVYGAMASMAGAGRRACSPCWRWASLTPLSRKARGNP